MGYIYKIINKITNIAILSNSDNDIQPVIHIRFNGKDVDKVKDPFNRETINDFIGHIIDKFKLKGIGALAAPFLKKAFAKLAADAEVGLRKVL